jgi:hypothetical protein
LAILDIVAVLVTDMDRVFNKDAILEIVAVLIEVTESDFK